MCLRSGAGSGVTGAWFSDVGPDPPDSMQITFYHLESDTEIEHAWYWEMDDRDNAASISDTWVDDFHAA